MPEADPREVRLREIIKTWQPLSKEPLTLGDAEEILWSVRGFFDTLAKIAAETKTGKSEGSAMEDERSSGGLLRSDTTFGSLGGRPALIHG